MSNSTKDSFSAAQSALGYIYQCRYALYNCLKKSRKEPDFQVAIETLDDIVFYEGFKPKELLQLKHHTNKKANLTDGSVDLWKTFRIWCERIKSNILPDNSIFYLITTANASQGTISAYLSVEDKKRDTDKAIERLNSISQTSTNKDNKEGYLAFQALNDSEKNKLVSSVYIISSSPSISVLDKELKNEIFWAVDTCFIDPFLDRLEGWWFRRSIEHLTGNKKTILSEEISSEMADLREQFKRDNLPIDEDILAASVNASGYQDKVFVHQLKMIEIGNRRIFYAIRNYFRAFEQRSRWVKDDLLLVGELEKYEQRLLEEWEILFERMKEETGEKSSEEEKKKAAQVLYSWAETEANIKIRSSCDEPFVTRGSYHILSDGKKVGWHPEFLERLNKILEGGVINK